MGGASSSVSAAEEVESEIRAVGEPEYVCPGILDRGERAVRKVEGLGLELHPLRGQLPVGAADILHPQHDAGVLADRRFSGLALVAGIWGERDRRSRRRDLDVALALVAVTAHQVLSLLHSEHLAEEAQRFVDVVDGYGDDADAS